MKLSKLLVISLLPIVISSCRRGNVSPSSGDTSNPEVTTNTSGVTPTSNTGGTTVTSGSNTSSSDPTSNTTTSEEPDSGTSIAMSEHSIVMAVGDSKYQLLVHFETGDDDHDGTWGSSNSSIASVDQYGRVTPVAKGQAVVTFTRTSDQKKASCIVTVATNKESIKREYVKVTDMDSIKIGDELIFGCPDFGVTASFTRHDRYLLPAEATFSGDGNKITNKGSDTGVFYVEDGVKDGQGNAFTLSNTDGEYLAGKVTQRDTSLEFVKSKGQINWIFEHSNETNKDYCVNYDITEDYWLMFNKISNSDIRFNLYQSSGDEALIKLATIYRLEITEIN